MRRPISSRVRPSGVLAAVVASLVAPLCLGAPPARAGLLTTTATGCDDPALEQPFARWVDPASYVLAPNGTVTGGGRWALQAGAAPGPGNESFYVHGTDETSSLELPSGSSATTGAMCVGLDHPTLRFFARNTGSVLSALKVEVLFEDALGSIHSLPIGLLLGSPSWQPTLPLPVVANLLPLLPEDQTAVAFRFTPTAGGDWSVDDVYVDPWRHG